MKFVPYWFNYDFDTSVLIHNQLTLLEEIIPVDTKIQKIYISKFGFIDL